MNKIIPILVLIVVLVIGVVGIFVFTSNSLENSTVKLPDGWKKLNVKDNFQTPNTLHYDYVPARNESNFNKSDNYFPILTAQIGEHSKQELNEFFDYLIEEGADETVLNETTYRKMEAKNITIERINVKYVKNTFFTSKDNKTIVIDEEYFFQKGNKYYIVGFSYNPSNSTTSSENPYQNQIGEAIESIIKTI